MDSERSTVNDQSRNSCRAEHLSLAVDRIDFKSFGIPHSYYFFFNNVGIIIIICARINGFFDVEKMFRENWINSI